MASEARPAGKRPRVAMLLHKPVWNDSRVRRAAGALAGAGHDVTVIHLPRDEHPRAGQLDGCRVVPALPPALARRRLPLQGHRAVLMAAFVRAVVRERPDVVHAHDAAMLLPGAVGARLAGARLVYDSHELATGVPYREPHWARFVAALERAIVPRCAGVVTVSDGIAGRLQELYRLPVRPTVVRNIPDVAVGGASSALPPRPSRGPLRARLGPLRARLGLRADQPLVLHQGALAPRRGCEAAVAAIGRLPSAHLVFLGDPWPGYAGEVERVADRMGARGRIHFLPSVPVERLVEHTADANVGLSLLDGDCDNHRLALPNKVFEYVAAGVPVVVSDLPELRALVDRHGIGRCCDPSDAAGLAAAVAGVLETGDSLVSRVTAAARELTWAAERQRLTRMYERLGKAPSRRGRPPSGRAMVAVRNGCTHDARVLREADTLRRLGLDPLIVGVLTASDRAPAETLDGIPVRRLRPGGAPGWLRGLRRGRPAPRAPDSMETAPSPTPPPRSRGGAGRRGGALRRLAVTADWYRRGIARALDERPALVHCNDYNTMWIGIAAKLLCRSRLVYDSHELWPDRNRRPEWRPWLLACEWLFVRVADVVLTTSPAYAERIAARYGVPMPVVVRNVSSRATPSANGSSAGSAPSRNGRLAAYFGAVTSGRGLEAAVAALAEVEDLELRIVGPDSRGYGARLAALARELGVERRLELLPPVRPAEAGRALAGADVGLALIEPVCRSYELTLPNKLFEYMEAGLPVVATDLPAMSALLAETGAGVSVRAGEAGAVAAGLRAALEPRRNAELRAAACDAARRLTWDREREILTQAYDGALAGAR